MLLTLYSQKATKADQFLNRNSTSFAALPSSPDTYIGYYEEISKLAIHLNVFERMWAAWYAYMDNDVLATGIMSFVMHEVVYFGRSLPWIIIDRIQWFNKYKIQGVCTPMTFATNSVTDKHTSKKSLPLPSSGTAPSSFF